MAAQHKGQDVDSRAPDLCKTGKPPGGVGVGSRDGLVVLVGIQRLARQLYAFAKGEVVLVLFVRIFRLFRLLGELSGLQAQEP